MVESVRSLDGVYAGEKALGVYGHEAWLPDETIAFLNTVGVAIKGPLTTPVSGGFDH